MSTLIALADTHGIDDPRLSAHLRETISRADHLVHAGDFTTSAVLDAFEGFAPLTAVCGNSDSDGVCERLPTKATLDWAGHRVVVVHGHRHDRTSLPLFARQEQADIVVVGHTHRPALHSGETLMVNPGSHTVPRGGDPTYARFEQTGDGIVGGIYTTDGTPTKQTVER